MATIAAALVTTIDTNWNVGLGGAKPTIRQLMADRGEIVHTTEQVIVRVPWFEDSEDINDSYSNIKYTLTVRIKTTTDEDRLKEIKDEVIRVVRTNAVTGIDRQTVGPGENKSDKSRKIFIHELKVICEEHVTAGGSSYSGTTTGDVTVAGDLDVTGNADIVGTTTLQGNTFLRNAWFKFENQGAGIDPYFDCDNAAQILKLHGGMEQTSLRLVNAVTCDNILDEDAMGSDSATSLATQQSIKAYVDATVNSIIGDLTMYGSANAAWVPMTFAYPSDPAAAKLIDGRIINVGAANYTLTWMLPLSCNRGGLKLYLKALMYAVQDADAQAYIDSVRISGINANTRTDLDTDPTDHTSAGDKTFSGATFPAAVLNCSSYQSVFIKMDVVTDAANELDIHNVRMQCYYAA